MDFLWTGWVLPGLGAKGASKRNDTARRIVKGRGEREGCDKPVEMSSRSSFTPPRPSRGQGGRERTTKH